MHGKAAGLIARCDERAAVREDEQVQRAVNELLNACDALREALLDVDERSNQLVIVDLAARHRIERGIRFIEADLREFGGVVDDADRADGERAELRADQQGLGERVADAADGGRAVHLVEDRLELRAERSVLDAVDATLQTDLAIPGSHAAGVCSQMGVIIGPEKRIQHTILLRSDSEKTTHSPSSYPSLSIKTPARCR